MAKELPYFKFEPAEYLTKDISFCSLAAQGLFINVCSYYWQRNCELTKDQLLKRLNYPKELGELMQEGVIDITNNIISIKFLDKQLSSVEDKSKTNTINGSKGGRPKKNPIKSESKANDNPTHNPTESESKGIREDKIRVEKIREEKIKKNKTLLSEIEISDVQDSLKIYFSTARYFQKVFLKNLTDKGTSTKHQENATFADYVSPIRLMIENKECTMEDLREVAKFLNSADGEFWKSNILSTTALRKNITKLLMQAREDKTVKKAPQKQFFNSPIL